MFRRQGYAATGLNEILAASGAPKGSLYHYFPDGKAQIGAEVVRVAGRVVSMTLTDLVASEPSPADVLRRYARMVVGWLERSEFRDGSPITTILLELAPHEAAVTAAGREAFAAYSDTLDRSLVAAGVPAPTARRLALLAVCALDGALVRARVEQDGAPVVEALDQVADLLDRAVGGANGRANGRSG